ncbi:hypothetical protein WR25_21235 [Diploscapter pachys]|uniref:Exocyst complex component 2 n=1 Tax=Diploscapter pachys TaxID=2018661 RepID=A0A2A2JDH6_9BILA|nr:hypothetical protein WR25_21235 [Diploscapter pachys]
METLARLHERIESKHGKKEYSNIRKVESQINEAKTKAESVFHDVLSRKDRADATRNALSLITRNKFLFLLSRSIDENMKKGEYLTILNDYTRVKAIYKDTNVQLFREVLIELDKKMDAFKEEMKRKLILETPVSYEEQSKLIKYLKILDPNSDPAWDCIESYYRWLEKMLWDLQTDYAEKAIKKEKERQNLQNGMVRNERFVETNERQAFVSELVAMLLSKLPSFWKLSQTYNHNDERWKQRHEDISQMLTNIINVSSWLILNALVPKGMPESVIKEYSGQFAKWPEISASVNRTVLINSVKTLRSLISTLIDSRFIADHLNPLTELCMTVRLKVVSDQVDKATENIANLGRKANWKQDVVDKGITKTIMPDMYENEVIEVVNSLKEILATSGYQNEQCLFSKERFKSHIIDLLVHLLTAIKYCFDRLLNIRDDSQGKRPEALELKGDKSEENQAQSGYATAKKLLICICDLEFIERNSLQRVAKQMDQIGIRAIDVIIEKSAQKLSQYRQTLVKCYINSKSSIFDSIIVSATYEWIPYDDVSDYAKELMMCCVVQQSEMELCAPQLTVQSLQEVVNYAFSSLLEHLEMVTPDAEDVVTQIVIDVCALEEALSSYTSLETKARLNSFRKTFVGQFDQEKLQMCLKKMRTTMRLVLDSLYREIVDLDSSTV